MSSLDDGHKAKKQRQYKGENVDSSPRPILQAPRTNTTLGLHPPGSVGYHHHPGGFYNPDPPYNWISTLPIQNSGTSNMYAPIKPSPLRTQTNALYPAQGSSQLQPQQSQRPLSQTPNYGQPPGYMMPSVAHIDFWGTMNPEQGLRDQHGNPHGGQQGLGEDGFPELDPRLRGVWLHNVPNPPGQELNEFGSFSDAAHQMVLAHNGRPNLYVNPQNLTADGPDVPQAKNPEDDHSHLSYHTRVQLGLTPAAITSPAPIKEEHGNSPLPGGGGAALGRSPSPPTPVASIYTAANMSQIKDIVDYPVRQMPPQFKESVMQLFLAWELCKAGEPGPYVVGHRFLVECRVDGSGLERIRLRGEWYAHGPLGAGWYFKGKKVGGAQDAGMDMVQALVDHASHYKWSRRAQSSVDGDASGAGQS